LILSNDINTTNEKINSAALEAGIYFYKVIEENGIKLSGKIAVE
jgi:hypothetical protein